MIIDEGSHQWRGKCYIVVDQHFQIAQDDNRYYVYTYGALQ